MTIPACHHVIAHWVTDEDRQQINHAVAYAREIGDIQALPLLLARLTQPCNARDSYRAQKESRPS
ncbi:hypothetical protein [Streptomyces beihaiensis]|uniref:Uncharacterized protein n=1 Tax=Streptomyces beihaiensis TaxID=2984495 RepID=A0ABT3TRB3_9ACTN|nr:hypothetical protein [Streptomyces beihaiensis]MCX3059579.1 hypothetical protein [Streptomyces beihaiensis]